MKTVQTYLPMFSGFYNTIWDFITDGIIELDIEHYDCEYDDIDYDFEAFHNELAEMITHEVGSELQKMGYISNYKFEKLVSPRFYNFSNDSINVEIEISEENEKNISEFIGEYFDEYHSQVKYDTTGRSGYSPHYSVIDFIHPEYEEVQPESFEHPNHLGYMLDFICNMEGLSEEDMIDFIIGNIFIPINNWEELQEKFDGGD